MKSCPSYAPATAAKWFGLSESYTNPKRQRRRFLANASVSIFGTPTDGHPWGLIFNIQLLTAHHVNSSPKLMPWAQNSLPLNWRVGRVWAAGVTCNPVFGIRL